MGFKQLIKRLHEDGIEKDKRFTPDSVAVWWRENFGEEEGVSEETDFYCSNRLRLLSLPPQINIIKLDGTGLLDTGGGGAAIIGDSLRDFCSSPTPLGKLSRGCPVAICYGVAIMPEFVKSKNHENIEI